MNILKFVDEFSKNLLMRLAFLAFGARCNQEQKPI